MIITSFYLLTQIKFQLILKDNIAKAFTQLLRIIPSPINFIINSQDTFILESDYFLCEFNYQEFFHTFKIDISEYSYVILQLPVKEMAQFLSEQQKVNYLIELCKEQDIILKITGYDDDSNKRAVCVSKFKINITPKLKEVYKSQLQQQIQQYSSESILVPLGQNTLDQFCYISRDPEIEFAVIWRLVQQTQDTQISQTKDIIKIILQQDHNKSIIQFVDQEQENEQNGEQEQESVNFSSESSQDSNEQEIDCVLQTEKFLLAMQTIKQLHKLLQWKIELYISEDMAWVSMVQGKQLCAIQIRGQTEPV